MTGDLVLHVLRNPDGWCAEAVREARLAGATRIEALEREVAALRADAERFRHICDMDTEDDLPLPLYEAWSEGPEAFRAAIDKAIAEQSSSAGSGK